MKKLLPVGFYDLLFDEAQENHKNVNLALGAFLKAGYGLIKTPLVEFAKNFSEEERQNSLQAVDKISGENLLLRSDITPQIARLLDGLLSEKKLPLKLCYVGDVLCQKSNELYADRQQTQVGVEIIGCDEKKSDLEIIELLLKNLTNFQKKNLLIEFSLPDFLEIFLAEIGEENNQKLRAAIVEKNLSQIKKLAKKNGDLISKIAVSNDNLKNLSKEISAKIKSKKVSEELKNAQKISEFLAKNFPQISARFDLFGDCKTSYHERISFEVFCGNFSYPIARGGRYHINKIKAVGATIYMNHLRRIC